MCCVPLVRKNSPLDIGVLCYEVGSLILTSQVVRLDLGSAPQRHSNGLARNHKGTDPLNHKGTGPLNHNKTCKVVAIDQKCN